MDNPSQKVWLESQDGDSSLEYLHLQSAGKREDQVIVSLRPDKLGYMKPWLKKKVVYLFIKKLKVKLQQSLAAKLRAT